MGDARDARTPDPTTREIDEMSSEFKSRFGYITKLQSRQLAWLKRWSRTEREERLRGYYLQCHDCNVIEVQHTASVAAMMVWKHAGHRTWLRMMRGSTYGRGR